MEQEIERLRGALRAARGRLNSGQGEGAAAVIEQALSASEPLEPER